MPPASSCSTATTPPPGSIAVPLVVERLRPRDCALSQTAPSLRMSTGPFLLVVTRDGKSETHAFHQAVVTIGRSRECDLFLPDRLISRLHCRVERQEGLFVLADAGA